MSIFTLRPRDGHNGRMSDAPGHSRTRRRQREAGLALLAACLALPVPGHAADTASADVHRQRVDFALIGDMPYDGVQIKEFVRLGQELDESNLAFVVHVGDFWSDGAIWKDTSTGLPPCSDETFDERLALAKASRHPFVFVPGDNDWTDCYRAKPRAYEPLERLDKLRRMFYPDELSLGRNTMRLARQSEDPRYARFRENVRWTAGGATFVTLHIVGSNNNLGRTPEMDAEYAERNAANLAWLRQTFTLARRDASRAVMVIAHANPAFENTWPPKYQRRYLLGGLGLKSPPSRRDTGYDEFLAALETETVAFGKPVVYAHGDTHTFRIDKPLVGSFSQRVVENFTRVETFGYQDTHWIRVTIDPDDPNVFRFSQQIVQENLANH